MTPLSNSNVPASQVDRVYDELIDRLLAGDLQPGDMINRRTVASEMGVSVSPVGEAMLQLESEGILETIPRVGTRVCIPTPRDVWGAQMTRIAIECQVARMIACDRIESGFSDLQSLARAADQASVSKVDYLRADAVFHRAMVEAAECAPLLAIFDRVARQSLLLISRQKLPPQPRSSHARLLTFLRTANPDSAEAALRKHIQSGKSIFGDEFNAPGEHHSPPRPASRRIHRSMNRVTETRQ